MPWRRLWRFSQQWHNVDDFFCRVRNVAKSQKVPICFTCIYIYAYVRTYFMHVWVYFMYLDVPVLGRKLLPISSRTFITKFDSIADRAPTQYLCVSQYMCGLRNVVLFVNSPVWLVTASIKTPLCEASPTQGLENLHCIFPTPCGAAV
jgi:hypothetical protein